MWKRQSLSLEQTMLTEPLTTSLKNNLNYPYVKGLRLRWARVNLVVLSQFGKVADSSCRHPLVLPPQYHHITLLGLLRRKDAMVFTVGKGLVCQ